MIKYINPSAGCPPHSVGGFFLDDFIYNFYAEWASPLFLENIGKNRAPKVNPINP